MSWLTDSEMANELRQQNKLAMKYFVGYYSPALYGIIFRILKNESLSGQALVDTFVAFWKYMPSHKQEDGRLFTCISNIASNIALERRQPSEEQVNEIIPDKALLEKFIRLTLPKYRTVLDMHFIKQYSSEDIATILHISEQAAVTRISDACIQLKHVLKSNNAEDNIPLPCYFNNQPSLAPYY